jgi:hypothetical protein
MKALESRDWSGAEVSSGHKSVSVVYSVRVDSELAEWIAAEADRRGVTPSLIIRDALADTKAAQVADDTVTVRLSDLHRAVNRIVKPIGYRAA